VSTERSHPAAGIDGEGGFGGGVAGVIGYGDGKVEVLEAVGVPVPVLGSRVSAS
jgi:hypothetical protein